MKPLDYFFDTPSSGEGRFSQRFCSFFFGLVRLVFTPLFRYRCTDAEIVASLPPGQGALLVGNHRSYLDPLFMMSVLRPRPIRFITKEEFFTLNPIIARMAAWVGAFPVKRNSADMAAIKRAVRMLKRGELVGIFPEGTRIRSANQEITYHEGVALIASLAGIPVIPVRIWGTEKICPEGKRFFRTPTVRLRFGQPLSITAEPFASLPKNQRNKAFTDEVMRQVYLLEQPSNTPKTNPPQDKPATIHRARHAGACYGVKRALRLVDQAIEDAAGSVYTLGPLIHNPEVVANLHRRGVRSIRSVDDIERGAGTVVIRSHGVSPQIIEAARTRGLDILDATCPHVSRVQAAANELSEAGYTVIVVGEKGHPEVEGISAYAGQKAMVVLDPGQLPLISTAEKIGLVAQTTQTTEALDNIITALETMGIRPEVRDTICFATRQRQQAASQLASEVDVMLVIGGRNSSNTTRLAELCSLVCQQTYHLESAEELDAAWFENVSSIGITAGASTPEDQIDSVERVLNVMLHST